MRSKDHPAGISEEVRMKVALVLPLFMTCTVMVVLPPVPILEMVSGPVSSTMYCVRVRTRYFPPSSEYRMITSFVVLTPSEALR